MSRNPTPTAILETRGAFIKHPEREKARESEPVSDRPLGLAPEWMTPDEKEVWIQLASELAPGVAFESDRTMFAFMVRLATKLSHNQPMMAAEMNLLVTLGAKFAMTPADRTKVTVEKPQESALEKFLAN